MRPCVSRKQTPYVRNCCLPLPPQTIIPFVVILPHNPAHVKSPKASASASNWFRGAPLKPYLPGDTYRFPSEPLLLRKCPIAFPCQNIYNNSGQQKKAGRKGATNTRPALCRRNGLSHTADITAPVFHYTPFYAIYQGGECSCALVSGVGNRNPCAAFVVSHGKAYGGREWKYHPQRLNR